MQDLSPCLTTLQILATLVHFFLTPHCTLKHRHALLILLMLKFHTFLKSFKVSSFSLHSATKLPKIQGIALLWNITAFAMVVRLLLCCTRLWCFFDLLWLKILVDHLTWVFVMCIILITMASDYPLVYGYTGMLEFLIGGFYV